MRERDATQAVCHQRAMVAASAANTRETTMCVGASSTPTSSQRMRLPSAITYKGWVQVTLPRRNSRSGSMRLATATSAIVTGTNTNGMTLG